MQLRKAKNTDIITVYRIVQDTIQNDYPNYYPTEVVDFFLGYHSMESITEDIERGCVYFLLHEDAVVGTGTIKNQNIERIYVLPQYQGRGFGTAIMELLEREIAANYPSSVVEASLVSYDFYLHRGYCPNQYCKYRVENSRVLCYYVMEKKLNQQTDIGINHIALYTNDLERMKSFYRKYFHAVSNDGYHNKTTGLSTYFLSFKDHTRLEIMTMPTLTEPTMSPYNTGYIHLAFSVGSRDAVDQLTAALAADGYTLHSKPRITGDGYYESCVLDPDGNLIEIVSEFLYS